MRKPLALGGGALALAAVGGLLFAWSGVYNVGASRGHWAVTRALLAFAMRSSVRTHAWPLRAPALDDPATVALGLGTYDGGCTPCHGAPGEPRNPIPLRAVPMPPYLPEAVGEWTPEQLFWIVKNGLKYTGMPAWPAPARDDEVWAVVAALVQLPRLDATAYRRWVRGEIVRDPARIEANARAIATSGVWGEDLVACARCHGFRGGGGGHGAFPRLTGLTEQYLYDALRSYAAGSRPSGVMQPIAVELADEEMRALARYYASIEDSEVAVRPDPSPDAEVERHGRAIAERGIPSQGVAACDPCHSEPPRRHPLYPSLQGQHYPYLVQQLHLWRDGVMRGTPQADVMIAAVRGLSDDDIRAVAGFYARDKPGARAPARDAGGA